MFVRSPALCKGATLAIFQSVGTRAVVSEVLVSRVTSQRYPQFSKGSVTSAACMSKAYTGTHPSPLVTGQITKTDHLLVFARHIS